MILFPDQTSLKKDGLRYGEFLTGVKGKSGMRQKAIGSSKKGEGARHGDWGLPVPERRSPPKAPLKIDAIAPSGNALSAAADGAVL